MLTRLIAALFLASLVACGTDSNPGANNEDGGSGSGEHDGGKEEECSEDKDCDDDEGCEDGKCVADPKPDPTTPATVTAHFDFRARHFTRWSSLKMRATLSRKGKVLFESSTPVDDLDEEHIDASITFPDVPLAQALVVSVEIHAPDSGLPAFFAAETVHNFQDDDATVTLGNTDITPQYEDDGTTEREPFSTLWSFLFAGFPIGTYSTECNEPNCRCLQASDCPAEFVCSELGHCIKPKACKQTYTSMQKYPALPAVECEPGLPPDHTCEQLGEGTGPLHCRDDCTFSLDWCGRECSQNWVECTSDADCCSGACDHYCVLTLAWQPATQLVPAGGWRRLATVQYYGHYLTARVRAVGDAGSAGVSSSGIFELFDFPEMTQIDADTPTNLRAAFSRGGSNYGAGSTGVFALPGSSSQSLPATHGAFQAITFRGVYDDLGRGYRYDVTAGGVEEGFTIREGVAIRAAAELPTPYPDYRDWVAGDAGTVAVVSAGYASDGPTPAPAVTLLRASGEDLFGVANLDGFAWAVGALGSVVRCDTTACEDVVIPDLPQVTLRDVAAISDVLYMVGDAGTILSYSPRTGRLVNSSNPEYGNLVSVGGFNQGTLRMPILVLSESGMIWQRPMPPPQ